MNSDQNTLFHFIRSLLSASVNASLYTLNHPQVKHLAEEASRAAAALLTSNSEITLVVVDNELVVNGEHQQSNLTLNRFSRLLISCGIGHLKIRQGISPEQIVTLISCLSKREECHRLHKCPHLRFGTVQVRLSNEQEEGARERVQLPAMTAEEQTRFLELYEGIKRKKKLKVSGMVEVVSRFIEAFNQETSSLLVMAALRSSDDYTFTHSTNVCILNLAQAKALGITGEALHDIGLAAMLHDIGKLFIPEEILTKKGKLTNEEFAIIQDHPVKGARYLLDSPGVPKLAVVTAYEHHMKYNGTGYPAPPQGWQPNLCSHMTMISDFFDALRTRRPYREPMELNEVAKLMMDMSGADFHPVLTRNFLIILQRLIDEESAAI